MNAKWLFNCIDEEEYTFIGKGLGLPHTQGPIQPYTYVANGLRIQGSLTPP
jgi:hypothetical protein